MAIRLTPQEPEMDYVHGSILVQLSTGSALRLDFGQGDIQAAE